MIYLDNAATTLKKPPEVLRAVEMALKHGGNAGRGANSVSGYSENIIMECRSAAARMFGVMETENIAFTFNATHALNIAMHSLIEPGMRVIASGYEHNAVYRPLMSMKKNGVDTRVVKTPLFEPEVFLHKFEEELRRGADVAVCTHVSNVFGYILPIERVDELCFKFGVPLIIDASQSAGHMNLNVGRLKAAKFVCMPGHKGLMGPQGTGIIICMDGAEPLLYGGTGADSLNEDMPEYLPERLEAGTQNLPGIAGLNEGIRFVMQVGAEKILEHERQLLNMILSELKAFPMIKPYAAEKLFCQSGVLSVVTRGIDADLAAEAFARKGIALRAGLHCAPVAHKSADTLETGTLRISPSVFTTPREITQFLRELKRIVQ
ncbi:MAG: aminotransferase class V-fold PLP-dependent enzyme [Oscillospiraceae bacterium]|jgi:cysteine desulfurase family protein|nr:aminotransferase class V-fold PLP-dependent enzyme [Oscillospiraceae bacterium]